MVTQGQAEEAMLRGLLDAFGRQDIATIAAAMAPAVEFEVAFPHAPRVPHRGCDAVVAFFARVFDPETGFFQALRFVDVDVRVFADGRGAAVEYRSEGVLRESGHRYANRYVGIFEFEDGRVRAWREYANPDLVRAALAGELGEPR
jgi:ketosteroid isomerase-like protein